MRHGWAPGWNSGCRCQECSDWKYRYDKFRRHQTARGTPLTVDATGTVRRIHALAAIGWTMKDLSARLGYSRELLRVRTQRKRVTPRVREQIIALYDELCMTPGPSQVGAKRAQEKGWAPPLAWDDIDTDPAPVEWRSQRRRRPSSELVEDVADLLAAGEHASVIAARLGVTVATLARNLARTAPHLAPPFEKERKRSAA